MACVIRSRSAQRWFDLPVGLVEELDPVDADLRRRGALLSLPELGKGRDVGGRVVAALVAARGEEVANERALADPASDRAGCAELDIVGMRRDDEDAVGSRQLSSGIGSAVILTVRPARRSAKVFRGRGRSHGPPSGADGRDRPSVAWRARFGLVSAGRSPRWPVQRSRR